MSESTKISCFTVTLPASASVCVSDNNPLAEFDIDTHALSNCLSVIVICYSVVYSVLDLLTSKYDHVIIAEPDITAKVRQVTCAIATGNSYTICVKVASADVNLKWCFTTKPKVNIMIPFGVNYCSA